MNEEEYEYDFEYQYAVRPNKSAIKRENEELEELAMAFVGLADEKLRKLDLPAVFLENVLLAKSIEKHHGAFKRQRKYLAKLLRDLDVDAIRGQLEKQTKLTAQDTYQLHLIEKWRDRLINGDDHDLNALIAEHVDAERQKLRQLIRDARKEKETDAPPRSARLLFKYLKELLATGDTQEDFVDESETNEADDELD